MKTVLSNAKKYLSILLAAAMVVLSVPNAPVTLLAATVDETSTEAEVSTESTDTAEVVENTDTTGTASEEAASAAEETTPAAEEAAPAVEEAVEAEEAPVASESAIGGEEEPEESNTVAGIFTTPNGGIVVVGDKDPYNATDAARVASANQIYIVETGYAKAIASDAGQIKTIESGLDRAVAEVGGTVGTMTWETSDKSVLRIVKDGVVQDAEKVTVSGKSWVYLYAVAPGTATVSVTWKTGYGDVEVSENAYATGTDKSGKLKVTVLGVRVSDNTTGVAVEDGYAMDLVVASANTADYGVQNQRKETASLMIVSDNGNKPEAYALEPGATVSWNAETQTLTATGKKGSGVVSPNEEKPGKTFTAEASSNDGIAELVAMYMPNSKMTAAQADATDNMTFKKEYLYVTNKTGRIDALNPSGKAVSANTNGVFTESKSGVTWDPVYYETVAADSTTEFTLSTVDQLGETVPVTEYTVSYNDGKNTPGSIIESVAVEGNKVSVKTKASASTGTEEFTIYAFRSDLTKPNGTNETGLCAIANAGIRVANAEKFGFVASDDDTSLTRKQQFVSHVPASQNGSAEDSVSYNQVDLYTTSVLDTYKRTWDPEEVDAYKLTSTTNGVSYNAAVTGNVTANDMARIYSVVTDNNDAATAFGSVPVKASATIGSKEVSDNFQLDIIGLGRSDSDSELTISNNNYYMLTLGIMAISENISANVTDNANKDSWNYADVFYKTGKNGATVSGSNADDKDIVIYGIVDTSGTLVTPNTAYAESTELAIFGPSGTMKLSEDETKIKATGVYAVEKQVGNDITANYKVIDIDDEGIITAVAPGTTEVQAIFTDATKKNTWATTVYVEVVELADELSVTANSDKSSMVVGDTAALTTTIGTENPDLAVDATKLTPTFKITAITENGSAVEKDSTRFKELVGLTNADAEYEIVGQMGGGASFTVDADKAAALENVVEYEIGVEVAGKIGSAPFTKTGSGTDRIKVVPSNSVTPAMVSEDTSANQFLPLGGATETISFNGTNGLDLVFDGTYDTNVIKAELDNDSVNSKALKITPVGIGKTAVTVAVPGVTTDKPLTVEVTVYGVKSTNGTLVYNEKTKRYDLSFIRVGAEKPSATLSAYTIIDGSEVPVTAMWSAANLNGKGSIETPYTSGKLVLDNSDTGSLGVVTATTTGGTYNGRNIANVNIIVDKVSVNIKTDRDDSEDNIAFYAGSSETGLITPTITYENAKNEEIDAPEGIVIEAVAQDEKVATATWNEKTGMAEVDPVDIGKTGVSINVKDASGTLLKDISVPVAVKVYQPFTISENDKNYVTDNESAVWKETFSLEMLSNFAVTKLGSDDYAEEVSYEPTITEAMANNLVTFSPGWTWKNGSTLVKNALKSTEYQATLTAEYRLAEGDDPIVTKQMTVDVGTLKDYVVSSNGSPLTETKDDTYTASIATGMSNQKFDVVPQVVSFNGGTAMNPGLEDLATWYINPSITVKNGSAYIVVDPDKVKVDQAYGTTFSVDTTDKEGNAEISIVPMPEDEEYAKTLEISTLDFIPEFEFATGNVSTTATANTFVGGANAMANGGFVVNKTTDDSVKIFAAISANGADMVMTTYDAKPSTTDGGKAPVIKITSSDKEVASVHGSKTTMDWSAIGSTSDTLKGYDIYSATIDVSKIGKTTISIEATSKSGAVLTRSVDLYVVEKVANKDITVDPVVLSNLSSTTEGEKLTFHWPTDSFFTSTSNEGVSFNGYNVIDPLELDSSKVFKLNNSGKMDASGNYELILARDDVEAGEYTVYAEGKAGVWYEGADGTAKTIPENGYSFSEVAIPITVVDAAFITASVEKATVSQNGSVTLRATTGSGYTEDVNIAFADADAAKALGLSIKDNVLSADPEATLGIQELDMVVEAYNKAGVKGVGEAKLTLTVEEREKSGVVVTPTELTVTKGKSASSALAAAWGDGVTRTNTFEIKSAADGITISKDGIISVASTVVSGNYDVVVLVSGKGTTDETGTATVKLTVIDKDLATLTRIDIAKSTIKQGESTTVTAVWSDGEARETTYALQNSIVGISLTADGTLEVAETTVVDKYDLSILATAADGSNGTAEVSIRVKDKNSGGNEPAPSDDDPVSIPDPAKEYKAVQVNSLNLLDVNDYAVVYFIGQNTNADPASVKIVEGGEYYELCDISEDRASLTNGYGAVGIRLKSDKRTDADAKAAAKAKKLTLEVNCLNADSESTPATVKITLKNTYKVPSYTLNNASAKTYAEFVPEGGTANFYPYDKTGKMGLETGEWEAVYMDSKKTTVDEDVMVEPNTYGFSIIIAKDKLADKSGFIRLHNVNWVDGAYTYVKWGLKLQNKVNVGLNSGTIVMNSNYSSTAWNYVTLGVQGIEDPIDDTHTVTLDTSALPEGLTATNDGVTPYAIEITIDQDANVKKGSYKVPITISGFTNNPVKKTMTIKVSDTTFDADKASKTIKVTQKGKIDGATGLGQIFLNINASKYYSTYAGADLEGFAFAENSGYSWADSNVVVTNENWKYVKGGTTETLTSKVLDANGVEIGQVSVSFKIVPTVGTFKATAENRTIDTTADTYDPEAGITTPLMVTNTYKYSTSATTTEDRVYMYDMTDETASKDLKVTVNGGTQVNATYENGIIKMVPSSAEVAKIKANKSKTFNVKVTVENTVTGKKANYTVKLTVQK